jgi:ribosomal-protein-alanine N-acetyltransferase
VWCAAYEEDPHYYNWAVCETGGTLIGSIGVMPGRLGCEIGYALARPFWGRGYAAEALIAVRDYLSGLGIAPLWCCHAVENPASGRVMEKAGFRYDHEDEYESYDHTRRFRCRCCRYPAE